MHGDELRAVWACVMLIRVIGSVEAEEIEFRSRALLESKNR